MTCLLYLFSTVANMTKALNWIENTPTTYNSSFLISMSTPTIYYVCLLQLLKFTVEEFLIHGRSCPHQIHSMTKKK